MAPNMFILSQRQASFKQRRRSSVANKSAPAPRWPHQELTPKQLAEAGFYYIPTPDSNDLVRCFLCDKSLDGWEPEDDPLVEHLRHSKDCGWALIATTKVQLESGKKTLPAQGPVLTNARLMTFGEGLWPHEGRGTGSLNMAKMVEAGFYYAPVKDGLDLACCCFCSLQLDGWELDDEPWAEHSKRMPDCPAVHQGKPKPKGRRTTRTSMLSGKSLVSESGEEEHSQPKPKKAKAKAATVKKSRKKAEKASSVEPDSDAKPNRGRKRSNSVSREPVILFDGRDDTEPESPNPPTKRRLTRTESVHAPSDDEAETSLLQSAKMQSPQKRAPVRSTSIMSARSQRTIDYDPDGGHMMDYDRPLSESEEQPTRYQKPFIRQTRRTTRSRGSIVIQDAPALSTRSSRSKTPVLSSGDPLRPPQSSIKKTFFRESGQDFSLPIKVPKHLEQPESPTARSENAIMRDDSVEESPPPPPTKKTRGRAKRVTSKAAKDPVTKPKRGKAARPPTVIKPEEPEISDSHAEPDHDVDMGQQLTEENLRQNSPEHMDLDEAPYHGDGGDTISDSESVIRHPVGLSSSPKVTLPARAVSSDEEDPQQDPEPSLPSSARSKRPHGKTLTKTLRVPTSSPRQSDNHISSDHIDSPTEDDDSIVHSEDLDTDPVEAPSANTPGHRVTSQALIPFNRPDSPSRQPLSAIRKQVQIAVRTTPRPKQANALVSTEPWSPMDLDVVFQHTGETSECARDGSLSNLEQEMTVEEWVKWNAANAERRLTETSERMVQKFEEYGKKALTTIEGIVIR